MKTPCELDPDLWFATDKHDRGRAIHQCVAHCPSREGCARLRPVPESVMAGIAYGFDCRALVWQPAPVPCTSCHLAEVLKRRVA